MSLGKLLESRCEELSGVSLAYHQLFVNLLIQIG